MHKKVNKTKLKTNTIISAFGLALAIGLSPAAIAAKVTDIAPETFAQYGKENAFWEARVSCENVESERVIQRKTDGDDWCPKGASNLCDTDKNKAAASACGEQYSSVIEQEARAKEQERQAQLAREKAQQEALRREQAAAFKPTAAPKPQPTISTNEAKLRSKISIQEERIKLDQAKLELRRKELTLERRAIEIEEILETLE